MIMKKIGQILVILFPVFFDRMLQLSEMRDKARILKIKYRFKPVGYKPSMKELEKYYSLVYSFHDEKFWFMGDIPTLGRNNKIF